MRRFFTYTLAALTLATALIMAGCEEAQAMPTAAGALESSSEAESSRAASEGLGLESSSETESSSQKAESSSEASGARSSDSATAENTTEEYIEEPSRQAAQEPETRSDIQETAQVATSSQEQETATGTRSDIQETEQPEPIAISNIQETSSASSNIQEQKLEPAPSNQPVTGWQPGNGPEGADGLPSTGPVEETPSGGSKDEWGNGHTEYIGKPEPSGTKGNQMVKNMGSGKWDSSIGGWRCDNGMIIYPDGNGDISNIGK